MKQPLQILSYTIIQKTVVVAFFCGFSLFCKLSNSGCVPHDQKLVNAECNTCRPGAEPRLHDRYLFFHIKQLLCTIYINKNLEIKSVLINLNFIPEFEQTHESHLSLAQL